jgi:hypothetical protein
LCVVYSPLPQGVLARCRALRRDVNGGADGKVLIGQRMGALERLKKQFSVFNDSHTKELGSGMPQVYDLITPRILP